ncbi:MAG: radical SAM protein [Patescibacteria group bacterium]|nr:radical SAM protein [Patescibacteria group bacterium]
MKKIDKKIIVWNVTSKCNLKCEFCFGPEQRVDDLNTNQARKMIDQFKMQGVEKIVFTGGEPLTRKDIIDLIQYAKKQGFYTILHTNGLLLTKEKLEMLAKFLDQINLPIDGCDEDTNMIIRKRGVFEKVLEILEWLEEYRKLKIVISTVVTQLNKDCIIKLANILPKYIYKWRVFQFKATGRAELFKNKYEISDQEFKKIMADVKKMDLDFEVQFVKKDDEFYKTYVIV